MSDAKRGNAATTRRRACSSGCAALFGLGAGSVRDDIEEALEEADARRRLHAAGAGDPQECAGAARRAGRRRHGAARRHHRGAARRDRRRGAGAVPHRRPFAPAGLSARRSTTRAAWSTSAISSTSSPASPPSASSPADGAPRRRAPSLRHGARRCSETPLVRPVLFAPPSMPALDLLREDAGDAHPYGAGHRRIWRHRRARLDRGHRRSDRRRHRGRARRGRRPSRSRAGPDGNFIVEARAPLDEVAAGRRARPRRTRGRRGCRHDRRPGDRHRRPRAGARRDRRRAAGFRVRNARRRSAPRQAGAHPSARRRRGADAGRRKPRRDAAKRLESQRALPPLMLAATNSASGRSRLDGFALSSGARAGALEALAGAVILAWGWPRRLIAFAAGAVGALAMPPFGFARR